MIHLTINRGKPSPISVQGEMFNGEEFLCHTLEDPPREVKIKGETGIPAGTYKGIVNVSARFKRMMPLLLNVPGFEGIRIHAGNSIADTEGCILVGLGKGENMVLQSRLAFTKIMELLNGEDFEITIK